MKCFTFCRSLMPPLLPVSSAFLVALGLTQATGSVCADQNLDKGPELSAGYKNGFFIEDQNKDFKLVIQGRMQSRYSYQSKDGIDESAFTIPRLRMTFKGHAFHKNIKYKFQTDYGKGVAALRDGIIDFAVVPKKLHLVLGQFTRPFSRQQITSDGRLNLVDRAITDKAFDGGRDIGFALQNNYEKSPTFEWAVGLFNGVGNKSHLSGTVKSSTLTGLGEIEDGKFSNVPKIFDPALVLRLGYNYGGIKGYSETDFEGGGFRFALGASTMINFDSAESTDAQTRAELDFIFKLHGFSTSGAYFVKTVQNGASLFDQGEDKSGAHIQLGHLFARRYQPVFRYAFVQNGSKTETETALGFSVYFFKHNVKWQTAVAQLALTEDNQSRADYRVRSQVQLGF
jgi:hypothetical protein